jgi:membrane protein
VVLVLLWVYYASCILFFGAEFTQAYARECEGRRVAPSAGKVPVTKEARAQQGMPPLEAVKKSKGAR